MGAHAESLGPLLDLGVGLAGLEAWKSAHPPAPSGEPHRCYRPDTLLAGLGQRGGRGEAGGGLSGPSGGPLLIGEKPPPLHLPPCPSPPPGLQARPSSPAQSALTQLTTKLTCRSRSPGTVTAPASRSPGPRFWGGCRGAPPLRGGPWLLLRLPLHSSGAWRGHMSGCQLLVLAKGNKVGAAELIKEGGRQVSGSWQAEWSRRPNVPHLAHVPGPGNGAGDGGKGRLVEQRRLCCLMGDSCLSQPAACQLSRRGRLSSPQLTRHLWEEETQTRLARSPGSLGAASGACPVQDGKLWPHAAV